MLKVLCMFEDGYLFYTLANFYREQSNLKGIFFEFIFVYLLSGGKSPTDPSPPEPRQPAEEAI